MNVFQRIKQALSSSGRKAHISISGSTINGSFIGRDLVIGDHVVIDGNSVMDLRNVGPVTVTVEGSLDRFHLGAGTVTVSGDVGECKTMSGDVNVRGAVEGDCRTMSGSVTAESIQGNCKTMSGNIRVR